VEFTQAHVVCAHCLREFDQNIVANRGEPGEARDCGIMLCPECLGVSMFEVTMFGVVARVPTVSEQQDLNLDPAVQAVLQEAHRVRPLRRLTFGSEVVDTEE
jgi:hypothetical protein